MQIRHKVNKGLASVDDATGEQLVATAESIWERWAPEDVTEPKKAPAKKAVPS